jgi:hypothetical protein
VGVFLEGARWKGGFLPEELECHLEEAEQEPALQEGFLQEEALQEFPDQQRGQEEG